MIDYLMYSVEARKKMVRQQILTAYTTSSSSASKLKSDRRVQSIKKIKKANHIGLFRLRSDCVYV